MALATVRKRYRNKGKPNEKFMGFQADYIDQNGKRHAKLFKLERDAKAWLAGVVVEVRDKVHTPARQSITVAEAADLWIEKCQQVEKLHTSTITQYKNHVCLHIAPAIGGVKISELTGPTVEEFKDRLLTKGSRAMAQKVLVSLKAILAEAKRKGRVAVNVAADVRLPKAKNGERRKPPKIGETILTKEQVRDILAQVEGTRWHPVLNTAVLAGLRSSELRGLRWIDVDIEDVDKASIRVVQRADENNQMDTPKSEAGTREIPIPQLLANILRRWREVCPHGKHGLCFPNGVGNVESHANIANRGLYAAQRRIGMVDPAGSPRYGMHSLRHFFASICIEQNHLPKRLQQLMGHASLQMTFDIYGALFPAGDGERQKMDEATSFLAPVKVA